jgi:hypothetical protein
MADKLPKFQQGRKPTRIRQSFHQTAEGPAARHVDEVLAKHARVLAHRGLTKAVRSEREAREAPSEVELGVQATETAHRVSASGHLAGERTTPVHDEGPPPPQVC